MIRDDRCAGDVLSREGIVVARFLAIWLSLLMFASMANQSTAQVYCTQKCTETSASRTNIPDDGKTRCECSCSHGKAVCETRSVNHSAQAKRGQAGSVTGDNNTSCSVQCPKNECFDPTTSPYAHCGCFECSALDPPKPK